MGADSFTETSNCGSQKHSLLLFQTRIKGFERNVIRSALQCFPIEGGMRELDAPFIVPNFDLRKQHRFDSPSG